MGPAMKEAAPRVIKPARIFWNQIIGLIFLLFAIPALWKAVQFSKTIGTDSQSAGRLAISLVFGGFMLFFGLASFWRARRISRT